MGVRMLWWRRRRREQQATTNPPAHEAQSVGFESPEVKTLTQGGTWRAGGLGFDETVGLASAAGILDAAAAGNVLDRGLRASGQHCARCGREFTEDTPVRRTPQGDWIHDICPTQPTPG